MGKLRPEDIEKIAEQAHKAISLREGSARGKITVHMGTCGIAAGARKIINAVMECIREAGIEDIVVTNSGCAGLCSREPMMTVELLGKAPVKYIDLTEEKVRRIFDEHVVKGNIVAEYALAMGSERTL